MGVWRRNISDYMGIEMNRRQVVKAGILAGLALALKPVMVVAEVVSEWNPWSKWVVSYSMGVKLISRQRWKKDKMVGEDHGEIQLVFEIDGDKAPAMNFEGPLDKGIVEWRPKKK